ncbi:endonuclease MutS2 [Aliarcobacter skirrowii]|uniref:Endonuclease MutS2 n=1 Tax=Aliarcobacter skirrowii CCUG 10374 TaxID=1032239 RepID=A0AAD0WNL3_9BACT|nr:endonuclease MutS2 [Aliarcobacter skirrowii]AXX85004.1 DNA mismatch binding protein, MutS2 family [Aliarcobacter skirrowii CCUG 10374]KAB0620834.1 endonuclease MutS2 [Aliarcobacter skirrowii CCUG 10374]RXI25822.1 endonuclease MutS2 [Aliarcobacter skirrowii CCUG 10374]SUU96473.1 MutS2 protein [Aliarcobacter skirrowii]
MENLIKKLDLSDYITSFSKLFARDKSIILEGDINIHYKLIDELGRFDFKAPLSVENLDSQLIHLQKQGILKIYEIFEFVKIVNYFLYLKRFNFEGKLFEWIDKIVIPNDILKICQYFDDKSNLKEGVNEDFDNIKHAIYKNKEDIKQSLYKTVNSSKLRPYLVDMQVHYINEQECLLLRGGFSNILSGSVIDRSNSGFFYVVPHSISELKQKQNDLRNKQEEILFKLCKEISSTFEKNLLFLKFINKEFDRFDHYQARIFFAKIGDKNFILPSKSSVNKLVEFSHPALANAKPISIDFPKSVVMITGVNAGGKTMMLKSILSAVFLSKYLLPYKAHKDTKVSNFKYINAVLDDPQSVKNDISTFAGRMVEFSKLFSSKNAIVGVDEIELGTDSDEAASLFKVMIEDLIQKDIKIVITTHHKRLAALMASNPDVELIAALYDEENQRPTYEFLQGTIGRSYAFETALRYGIPLNVVKKAKEVYGDDKDRLNELIERSSELEREYKQKIQKLNSEIENYQRLSNNLKEQKEQLDEHIYVEKSKLHKEYKDAREEAKKAIKTKLIEDSHRHLNISHKIVKEIEVEKAEDEIVDFKVNDRVKYRNTKGSILSIKGAKAFIETDAGLKMQVLLSELKRSGNPLPKPKKKVSLNVAKPQSGDIKLDLHGQRAEEAIENLDKFISDALLAGFEEVLVYHGIGTGKLAFAVKEFLKKHPKVKSFEDAHPSSGGFGAKVIKL